MMKVIAWRHKMEQMNMTPERLRKLANKLATNSLFTQDEIDTIKALNEYADALEKCEPVATKLQVDPYSERDGLWFSLDDIEKLKALPAGTTLYTTPKMAVVKVPNETLRLVATSDYANRIIDIFKRKNMHSQDYIAKALIDYAQECYAKTLQLNEVK